MLHQQLIRTHFPQLTEPELRSQMEELGVLKQFQPGQAVIEVGNFIKSVPLLLSGLIKVLRADAEGNEILLYYLTSGQTCAMSLTCCMADNRSQVRAVSEEPSTVLMIPAYLMDEWLIKYPSWKKFVMHNYHQRFEELLQTIDSIAFLGLEDRLLRFLQDRAALSASQEIRATHQEIAQHLNSTRVVISRLLKQLEKQGIIRLGRNSILLLEGI